MMSRVRSRQERLERLWEQHAPDVGLYALRRTDRETAKDVVSETFGVAWRRLDQLPESPLPWLYGVARRVLANQRRAERRRRALRHRLAVVEPVDGPAPLRDSALADALSTLSPGDREVLMLTAWEGLTPAEAAAVVDCSPEACRVRLHRARRRLAAALVSENGSANVTPRRIAEDVS